MSGGAGALLAPALSAPNGPRRGPAAPAAGKKQRILWDSDSATRGGKTSIAVLLAWLAAPGNYARWRSGKSQSGETREALCSEIKAEMQRHGILHRENANIRTQISELERAYDAAREWLAARGLSADALRRSASDDNDAAPGDADDDADDARAAAEVAVLRLCRYFHVLDPVLRLANDDAASARAKRPYAPRKRRDRELDDPPVLKRGPEAVIKPAGAPEAPAASSSAVGERPTAQQREAEARSQPSAPVAIPPSSGATPLPIGAFAVPDLSQFSLPATSMQMPAPGVFAPWGNPAVLSGLEEAKRLALEAAREDRERKRKLFEWQEENAQIERQKLGYELETARIRLAAERAVARRKMEDAGIPASDIERILAGMPDAVSDTSR